MGTGTFSLGKCTINGTFSRRKCTINEWEKVPYCFKSYVAGKIYVGRDIDFSKGWILYKEG